VGPHLQCGLIRLFAALRCRGQAGSSTSTLRSARLAIRWLTVKWWTISRQARCRSPTITASGIRSYARAMSTWARRSAARYSPMARIAGAAAQLRSRPGPGAACEIRGEVGDFLGSSVHQCREDSYPCLGVLLRPRCGQRRRLAFADAAHEHEVFGRDLAGQHGEAQRRAVRRPHERSRPRRGAAGRQPRAPADARGARSC
jgi:hypothetical protein